MNQKRSVEKWVGGQTHVKKKVAILDFSEQKFQGGNIPRRQGWFEHSLVSSFLWIRLKNIFSILGSQVSELFWDGFTLPSLDS